MFCVLFPIVYCVFGDVSFLSLSVVLLIIVCCVAEEFQLGSSGSKSWTEAQEEESSQNGGQDQAPGSKLNQATFMHTYTLTQTKDKHNENV